MKWKVFVIIISSLNIRSMILRDYLFWNITLLYVSYKLIKLDDFISFSKDIIY